VALHSVTIPSTTLPVGARDFGPANLNDNDTHISLTIDRTVSGGLDATPAARIEIEAWQSNDGGVTWVLIVGGNLPGGPQFSVDKQGVQHPYTTGVVGNDLMPGTGRRIKATLTVTGSSVTVQGSLDIV